MGANREDENDPVNHGNENNMRSNFGKENRNETVGDYQENRGKSQPEEDANVNDNYRDVEIGELTADDIMSIEFDMIEEACDFYDKYAKFHGFVAHKNAIEMDDRKEYIVMRELVSNRRGRRDAKHLNKVDRVRKPRDQTRTNCQARFRVRREGRSSPWCVVTFEDYHNHILTDPLGIGI